MKREVFIDGQHLIDVQLVSIPSDGTARSVANEAAQLIGVPAETLHVFKEDAPEPMSPDVVIEDADGNSSTLQVHQAEKVVVLINYLNTQKTKNFSPATRIQLVLDWAVGPEGFDVDGSIAPEMELALTSSPDDEVPHSAHLGRYAGGPTHTVEFDLVRGIIPNGSAPWMR